MTIEVLEAAFGPKCEIHPFPLPPVIQTYRSYSVQRSLFQLVNPQNHILKIRIVSTKKQNFDPKNVPYPTPSLYNFSHFSSRWV